MNRLLPAVGSAGSCSQRRRRGGIDGEQRAAIMGTRRFMMAEPFEDN
ncbi:hypothetical protein [Rosistilla oblonga]